MQNKWLILSAVACGTFMATLDSSIVNVALPSITQVFHTGLALSRWVVISYLFSITGLLLFFGKLADVLGRKLIFASGYVVFTFGCIICGFSHNIMQLIFSRGLQGFGAAMMMANGPAIVTAAFPATERGKALGTLAMVVSAGLAAGPSIGGILVRYWSWSSIFFVNIPFGILGTYLVIKNLPADLGMAQDPLSVDQFHRERKLPPKVRMQLYIDKLRYFDWLGAILWMFIQFGYSMAIDQENVLGMGGPLQKLISFGSAALFLLFVLWESSVKDPVLDLALFRSKTFLAANLAGLCNFIGISAVTILMPFYFQNVRGLPPHQIGLFMTAIPLTIFVTAPIAGRLSDQYGSRILTALGIATQCLAMTLLASNHFGIANKNYGFILLDLCLVGAGIGLFQSPNNNSLMGAVERTHLGVASAMLATIRNLGLVTGAAISTTLLMKNYGLIAKTGGGGPTLYFISSMQSTFITLSSICSLGIIFSMIRGKQNAAKS